MAHQTIIHLSDLHFRGKKDVRERVGRIGKVLTRHYPKVPVIITGDLTDSATASQMGEARKALDGIAAANPILVVPGNHDYAWRGNIFRRGSEENWQRYLGDPLGWPTTKRRWMDENSEPVGIKGLGVWQSRNCAYVGIDSGDPDDKVISAKGYISKSLATALKATLAKYRRKTRIVFLHHHPFTDGLFMKLEGSARLMNALKGNCELLLFGHQHRYGIWYGRYGIPLIVASHRSTSRLWDGPLMITVIQIGKVETKKPTFWHRLELV